MQVVGASRASPEKSFVQWPSFVMQKCMQSKETLDAGRAGSS